MSDLIAELNLTRFNDFPRLFSSLNIPAPGSLLGVYAACFVGPGWLRSSAGPALALSGLGGWCGKEFSGSGDAVNLVQRAGVITKLFPMQLVSARSFIDGKQGLSIHYKPGNPFPWPYVVDELRTIDANTLLGMTIANLRGLRGMAFPFLLQKSGL